MVNFLMIGFCMLAGMLFSKAKLVPENAHKGINTWILYLALPAISFKYIPKIEWSLSMLFPAVSSVGVWAGGWLFMKLYCRYKGYSRRTRSTLELAGGYGNTSFIGFPLIAAFFGEQYLCIAIICDQSLFLVLSTVGIISVVKGDRKGDGQVTAGMIFKRLVTFPPFIGCVSALVLSRLVNLDAAEPFFDKLAATVAPLALFSVGLQLRFNGLTRHRSQLSMTLLYKLLLAPVLVMVIALVTGIGSAVARISIFEAAMPTFITASMVAEKFHLNFRLINLVIGISILIGFLTSICWSLLLHWMFA